MENPFKKIFKNTPEREVAPINKDNLEGFLDGQFKETQDRAEEKNPGLFKKAWRAFAYDANTRIVTGALSTLASANPYAATSANIIRFLLGSLGGAAAGEGLTRHKFEKENIEKLKSYEKLGPDGKIDIEATKIAILTDLEIDPNKISEIAEILGNLSAVMSEKGQVLEKVIDNKNKDSEKSAEKDPFWRKHYDALKAHVQDLPALKKALIGLGIGGLGVATLPLSVALGVPTAVAAISGAGLSVAWANLNKENKKSHSQYEHADLVGVLKEAIKEKTKATDFDDKKASDIAKAIREAQKKYQNRKYAGLMKGALAGSAFVEGGQIFGGMLHSFSNVFQHGGAPVHNLSNNIPNHNPTFSPSSPPSNPPFHNLNSHPTRIFDQYPKPKIPGISIDVSSQEPVSPLHNINYPHPIITPHNLNYHPTRILEQAPKFKPLEVMLSARPQSDSWLNNLGHHPVGAVPLMENQYTHIGWIDHPNSKNALHNISEVIVKSELVKGHFTSHHLSHERFNLAVKIAEEKLRRTGQFNQNGSLDMEKIKYFRDKVHTMDIADSAIKYAQRIKFNSVEHIHNHILPYLHAQAVHQGPMLSRAGVSHKLESDKLSILMEHIKPKLSNKYIQYEPFAPHYIPNHQSPKFGPNDFYPVPKPAPKMDNLPVQPPVKPTGANDFWPVKKSGS